MVAAWVGMVAARVGMDRALAAKTVSFDPATSLLFDDTIALGLGSELVFLHLDHRSACLCPFEISGLCCRSTEYRTLCISAWMSCC